MGAEVTERKCGGGAVMVALHLLREGIRFLPSIYVPA